MDSTKIKVFYTKAVKVFKWSIIVFVVLFFVIGMIAVNTTYDLKDATARSFIEYTKLDLEGYKDANVSERKFIIYSYLLHEEIDHEDIEGMRKCMGSMSFNKSETILASNALNWCNLDKEKNPDDFNSYFNELEFGDKSDMAHIMCKNQMEKQLHSPATAEFPFFANANIYRGKGVYNISSYVDSKNLYGALVRTNFLCHIRHTGKENAEDADDRNWNIFLFEVQ